MDADTIMGTEMDALLLRSLQGYVRDTFGPTVWQTVCRRANLPVESFEPLLRYENGLADRVARTTAEVLDRPEEAVWHDMGTYLVTNPGHEGVRRLLRFGGVSFSDFLYSLEELPGRARLALPDLVLPDFSLHEIGPDRFEIRCTSSVAGLGPVLIGVLTAMADDYGALCIIDEETAPDGESRIGVQVLDSAHNASRRFDLALPESTA